MKVTARAFREFWREHQAVYPVVCALHLSFCAIAFSFDEYGRVFPEWRITFLFLKGVYCVGGLALAFYYYKKGANDLSLGIFMALLNIYVVTLMWLAPLYEMAYLQSAVACAFFRFRRAWLYPTIFGVGLAGILYTYHLQTALAWKLPPDTRADWVLISLVMLVVAALIQRFAINQSLFERERVERLGNLGHEALRILHDVKGLSSTPLLISQRLSDDEALGELAREIEGVQRFLRATQRLVNVHGQARAVDVRQLLDMAVETLRQRMGNVRIELPPDSRLIDCDPNRLFSVFYNVLLILVESGATTAAKERAIVARFDGQCLRIYEEGNLTAVQDSEARALRERVITSDLRFLTWKGGLKQASFELELPA